MVLKITRKDLHNEKNLIFLKHNLTYILKNPYFKNIKSKPDFHYKLLHIEYGSEN